MPKLLPILLLLCAPSALADRVSLVTGDGAPGNGDASVTPSEEVRADRHLNLPAQSVPADAFCTKAIGGEVPGISFRFFDPSWHYQAWEDQRAKVIAACRDWNGKKQDTGAIHALAQARQFFGELSLMARDEIVDATIRRLGPARDQVDTGTCFAQATADVASFHIGSRVSAMSVAVRNSQFLGWNRIIKTENLGKGGSEAGALRSAARATLCPDDQSAGHFTYIQSTLDGFESFYQEQYRAATGAKPGVLPKLRKYAEALEPGLSSEDFVRRLQPSLTLAASLGAWQDRQCNLRLNLPGPVVERTRVSIAEIEAVLDTKEPLMIGYDARVLKGTKPWVKSAGHASLIAAESVADGKKYFLLRNSWGADCRSYGADIAARCRDGHIWLKESELTSAAVTLTYVRVSR